MTGDVLFPGWFSFNTDSFNLYLGGNWNSPKL